MGQGDGGGHDVRRALGGASQVVERALHVGAVAAGAPRLDVGDHLRLHPWIDPHDRVGATEWRCRGLGEAVHADDDLFTRFDTAGAVGQGAHEAPFQCVDRRERAPEAQHVVEFGLGRFGEVRRELFHGERSVEQVVVLEQVGLEGEHLLHPQRPLLIPWMRQA